VSIEAFTMDSIRMSSSDVWTVISTGARSEADPDHQGLVVLIPGSRREENPAARTPVRHSASWATSIEDEKTSYAGRSKRSASSVRSTLE
jgi:hypothetical protein